MSHLSIHRDLLAIISAYAGISKKGELATISANLQDITESHTYLISLSMADLTLLICKYKSVKSGDISMDKYMQILEIFKIRKNEDGAEEHYWKHLYDGCRIALWRQRSDLAMKLLLDDSFNFKIYGYEVRQILLTNDKNIEIIKFLYYCGKIPLIVGNTSLRIASQNGFIEIVKWLLSISDKLDPMDEYFMTDSSAISQSANNGHIDVLKLLLNEPRLDISDIRTYKFLEKIFKDAIRREYPNKIIKAVLDKLCEMEDLYGFRTS